ncbi:energy transducer TonB [Bacteroides humanifaecis]|nr:energy transducer TonB [Bacteroides humanifaecis]UDL12477.1 energy transducer TonB [Bacteroides humanifaecis]
MKKLMEQIENSIQYPEGARKKGVEGRVIVQFFVDEKGKVIEPQVLKSVEPSLNKEALRIVSMLPTWKPGTWEGKARKGEIYNAGSF